MSCVYVNVEGGLGNQLFQVAAGYAHTRTYRKRLSINTSRWTAHQGVSPINYKNTIFKNLEYDTPYTRDVIEYHDNDLKYAPITDFSGNISINGYFQSLKYFQDHAKDFIDELVLPTVDTSYITDNNVAFHIRRGDYLQFRDIHHICDTVYFDKCFKMFENYQINVFTDSPEYVLREFQHQDFNLIRTSSELNDLTMISQHDNVVCSNSSFSWWGSYLGRPKRKIVVPDKWFADGRKANDIYRDEMIRIAV